MRRDYQDSVALYGGAFDPFHYGHVSVIRHLLEVEGFAKVLVVPSGIRPDKPLTCSGEQRYEMTRAGIVECFGDDNRIEVSDAHVSGKSGYSTIDLMRYVRLSESRPIVVVLGAEFVKDLPDWKEPTALQTEAEFLVIKRPGEEVVVPERSEWNISLAKPLSDGGIDISSTVVRSRLAHGEDVSEFLPDAVWRLLDKSR